MDAMPWLLDSARLIGWVLVHFVWQAFLLGGLYAVARALLPRGEIRYRFGMVMLAMIGICPLLTLWHLLHVEPATAVQAAVDVVSPSPLPTDSSISYGHMMSWQSGLEAVLPWIVLGWLFGVVLLSLRAWRQWCGLKTLVRLAEQAPVWQRRVTAMAERFGLRRRVVVRCSKHIVTPMLVGWLRPVILLPVAVTTGFPVAQVELILAHELAHVWRWDPVLNMLQVVLETLFFFHPVVHWVSRDVRNEREICSDRLALTMSGGSSHEFAAVLADLGEMREHHGALLLAANGGVLLDRVQYLMQPSPDDGKARMPARFAALMLGAILVVWALGHKWQQEQLQRTLSESIMQLQAVLTPAWQPSLFAHLPDLVPSRIEALHLAARILPAQIAQIPLVTPTVSMATGLPSKLLQVSNIAPVQVAPMSSIALATAVMPVAIRIQQPIYPQAALVHGIEGRVVVEFDLTADGRVHDPSVIDADPAGVFDRAAVRAMRGWKYAMPSDMVAHRRYRQVMAFTLNAGAEQPAVNAVVRAKVSCEVRTGTHICRVPDDLERQVARTTHF